MTREDFVARWRTGPSEWARIGALVVGARVCEDVLQDFEAVTRAEDDAELSLSEAAAESGYSGDRLHRLHRLGKLPAYRKGRNLFFRSGDLSYKWPGAESKGPLIYLTPGHPGANPVAPVESSRARSPRISAPLKLFGSTTRTQR